MTPSLHFLSERAFRRRMASVLCLVVMLPLLPFAVLQVSLEATARFIGWLFDGRWLARKTGTLCDQIEKAFRVDADTEYAEWRERMKAQRILSTKEIRA